MAIQLIKAKEPSTVTESVDSSFRAGETALQVSVYRSLEELPDSYTHLFEKAGRRSLFLTRAWFCNFLDTALDEGDQVRIYGVADESRPTVPAGMLLTRSLSRSSGLISLRKLSALANYYSPLFSPHLSPTSFKKNTLAALARAIAGEKPHWDAIELKPLEIESETFPVMVEEFRAAGFVVQTFFSAGNWYEPVRGRSYHEYFEGLRSSVRNIAKSKNKKIERTGRARCEIISGTEGLDAGIVAYKKIYSASWKVPEPYSNFVPGLIKTCALQGTLRLGLVYLDGEPAAAQVWTVHSGVASIYKMAYDPKYRDLSVGTYLTTRLMEHVIDVDRVHEVDYLTGDDGYKKDWMSQRRERWGILALNPRTLRGDMAIVRHVGGRVVKRATLSVADRFRRGRKKPQPEEVEKKH